MLKKNFAGQDFYVLQTFNGKDIGVLGRVEILRGPDQNLLQLHYFVPNEFIKCALCWGDDFHQKKPKTFSAKLSKDELRDELWKGLCFEFFLSPLASNISLGAESGDAPHSKAGSFSDPYFEFNLGAKLHQNTHGYELQWRWNLYRLDSYRQGLRSIQPDFSLNVEGHFDEKQNGLFLKLSLPAFWANDRTAIASSTAVATTPARLGLSLVLPSVQGTDYLALKHCGQKPDFHLLESFCLNI